MSFSRSSKVRRESRAVKKIESFFKWSARTAHSEPVQMSRPREVASIFSLLTCPPRGMDGDEMDGCMDWIGLDWIGLDWMDGWIGLDWIGLDWIGLDGWMDGWVDGWVGGRMGGWVYGWIGGWVDGWMGGWVDSWLVA